jgi:hypothetical protein
VFGEKVKGLKGLEVSPSLDTTTLIGGGVLNPVVGNSAKALGLNYFMNSREKVVSNLSPSKPRLGGEK